MSALEVHDIGFSYGKTVILRDASLSVRAGETLVLFGPSGVGKTTLLRIIAGVESAASGAIVMGGKDVSHLAPEHRRIGMAFQNFALYPHLPAFENIASPLRAKGLTGPQVEQRVEAVARMLRISHVLGHRPRELSNGQKQRTALARALVGEPEVLLLDDPLRNVDAKLRYEMRLELPRLLRRSRTAVIFVTQDYREAMALGDRVAVLLGGSVVQNGSPEEIYDRPTEVSVARLFGDPPMNLLSAKVRLEGTSIRVAVAGLNLRFEGSNPPADILVGLRPEDVVLGPAGQGATARVVAVTPLHERQVVLLRAADGTELVASTVDASPPAGAAVGMSAAALKATLFDAATGVRVAVKPASAHEAVA